MHERLTKLHEELQALMTSHNKVMNPSGVPYKGEKKRTAEALDDNQDEDIEEASSIGKMMSELSLDLVIGISKAVEFCVKGGKLCALAVEDVVLSAREPSCQMWGEYVTGNSPAEKKTIAKNKSSITPVVFGSTSMQGNFSMIASQSAKVYKNSPASLPHPSPLSSLSPLSLLLSPLVSLISLVSLVSLVSCVSLSLSLSLNSTWSDGLTVNSVMLCLSPMSDPDAD